ncbi:MAG TPA: hypothetical protein VMT18_10035, partial [Planctomycetota bacterium]|nr:hypothetical protein [Planctomycetota bacterium]
VETALIEDLQWDVFGERIQHVEFRRVDRHAKTDVVVPLEFFGEPKDGGVVMHMLNELTILCTPDAIPDSIVVKVGDLAIGDTVTVGQIALPAGIELFDEMDPEDVVAHVVEPKEEEPVAAAPEDAASVLAPATEAPKPEGSED